MFVHSFVPHSHLEVTQEKVYLSTPSTSFTSVFTNNLGSHHLEDFQIKSSLSTYVKQALPTSEKLTTRLTALFSFFVFLPTIEGCKSISFETFEFFCRCTQGFFHSHSFRGPPYVA